MEYYKTVWKFYNMEHFKLGHNVLVNFCLSVEVSFVTSISSIINFVYELPHKVSNGLILRNLGN